MHGNTRIFDSVDLLLNSLVSHWDAIAKESILDHGAFHVALAGGGTPRHFYSRLAEFDKRCSIEWDKVHLYFGDERCVPQNDEESNFRMARETLFSKVSIPNSHIHPMYVTSLSPEENALHYADLLERQLPNDADGKPIFDLVLLGMGEDGHTASLFPDTEILNEKKTSVAAQFVKKLGVWRISLTYPTLNAARHVALLVVGTSKAKILSAISALESDDFQYPVQVINPCGELQWFLDKDAAQLIVPDVKS